MVRYDASNHVYHLADGRTILGENFEQFRKDEALKIINYNLALIAKATGSEALVVTAETLANPKYL